MAVHNARPQDHKPLTEVNPIVTKALLLKGDLHSQKRLSIMIVTVKVVLTEVALHLHATIKAQQEKAMLLAEKIKLAQEKIAKLERLTLVREKAT